ncbi:unnamed protein product [Dibothriocephalus latus]|uniref:Alpha-2-macroglobulin domain-containing protein n=1 Tax=Dibothriocephalus latus TaxID=60516 RepID=A0A3P6UZC9_DIBLA|nr:unnamed protein product [Dibothriocephalus latus]
MVGWGLPPGCVALFSLSLFVSLPVCLAGLECSISSELPKCECDRKKMVTLFIPRLLLPDQPNLLRMRSIYPLNLLIIDFSVDGLDRNYRSSYQIKSKRSADGVFINEVHFRLPFVTWEGGPINLRLTCQYCIPDEDDNWCQFTEQETQIIRASFVNKFVVIIRESDKPRYKPGEDIRFRFVALNTRHLYPNSEKLQWPKFKIDSRNFSNGKFVRVTEDERHRREGSLGFDVIYIEDPNGNRVKEWTNVPQTTAFNMSFPLPLDASAGVWRIVARVFTNIQTLQVHVNNNALSRFLAAIEVPKEVDYHAETANFDVCAKYTGGISFQGHYDAQICVGTGSELMQPQNLDNPSKNEEGVSGTNSAGPRGQCHLLAGRIFGTPENGGCVSASFSMKSLMQHTEAWIEDGHKLSFLVKIRETDTESGVIRFGQAEIRVPKLDSEIDSTYRPGLPIYGKVRLLVKNDVAMRISLIGSVTVFDHLRNNIYSTKLQLNSNVVTSFILPPVNSESDIQIRVGLIREENTTYSTRGKLSPVIQRMLVHVWQQKRTESLRRWKARSSLALKVRGINSNCTVDYPRRLKLSVMANAPLAGKTLFLEYLWRGLPRQWSTVLQPATSGYNCSDEDSDFGHYICNAGFPLGALGEISCRPGWTGENCMRPHGSNEKREKAQRTIFMHEAIFEMDSHSGPTLRAVVYVVNNDSSLTRGYEIISDHLQNLNFESCPKSSDGDNLDKHTLMPGDTVGLTLNVPTARAPQMYDIDNTCILRLVDTSLKNFENFQETLVNINQCTNELRTNVHLFYNQKYVYNTKTAFQAIGLNFMEFRPSGVQLENKVCEPDEVDGQSMENISSSHIPEFLGDFPDPFVSNSLPTSVCNSLLKTRSQSLLPEVWLFEHVKLDQAGRFKTQLIAPNRITSWEFTALCFTPNLGIWMPRRPEPETVTILLPFNVEFIPPMKVRRHEILHVPVSIFMLSQTSANKTADEKTCYEIIVSIAVDRKDWRLISSSNFTKRMCHGDPKATFTVDLQPLRLGRLNMTAEASTPGGSVDAVRRLILVVPEGVEAEANMGGELCIPAGRTTMEKVMRLDLPEEIEEGSLRGYFSVSGDVLGKPMKHLDNLVSQPTGCGEQNMAKVAPSVYVLKYLVAAADLQDPENKKLAQTTINYISSGYTNQLRYRKPDGSFVIFPHVNPGSTWLTAYVFGVFSEAERLLQEKALEKLRIASVTFDSTISKAFEFLKSTQRKDGCFVEYGRGLGGIRSSLKLTDLLVTSYVLSALFEAPATLKKRNAQQYTDTIDSAGRCLLSTIDSFNISNVPLQVLVKVAFALRMLIEQPAYLEKRELVYEELDSRASEMESPSGALRWWKETANPAAEVENTVFAYLALARYHSCSEQRPIIRWLLTKQNDRGGFYSTYDTVLALRALADAAECLKLSGERNAPSVVTATILPAGLKSRAIVVNRTNAHTSQQVELDCHNHNGSMEVKVEVSGPVNATCVVVHLSAVFCVPSVAPIISNTDQVTEHSAALPNTTDIGSFPSIINKTDPEIKRSPFFLTVRTTQAQDFTPECIQPKATICVRLSESAVTSNDSIDTNMILLAFQLPTGWTIIEKDLTRLHYPGLGGAEFDVEKETLFAYFDPFTDLEAMNIGGRNKLVRCISRRLKQQSFSDPLKPSLIFAEDYYNPQKKTEIRFLPSNCKLYWESRFSAKYNRTEEI